MKENLVKNKLENGEAAVGVWLSLGSPNIAEYIANFELDWLCVDTQHGLFGHNQVIRSFQAISKTGTVPIARVASNERFLVNKLQDAGTMGIIFPMINSKEEAEKAVDYALHSPKGSRSCGGARQKLYSDKKSFESFSQWVDEETLIIVMIETAQAVKNAESILSVEGIDACFIGPRDLATSMETKVGSKLHENAIMKTLKASKKKGIPAGIYCFTGAEEANKRLEQGFQLISIASDTALIGSSIHRINEELK
ncbi:MAG: aldolase/citrate lyase family protein, partial [Candidatus Bipolaricaulota bacterium]